MPIWSDFRIALYAAKPGPAVAFNFTFGKPTQKKIAVDSRPGSPGKAFGVPTRTALWHAV